MEKWAQGGAELRDHKPQQQEHVSCWADEGTEKIVALQTETRMSHLFFKLIVFNAAVKHRIGMKTGKEDRAGCGVRMF